MLLASRTKRCSLPLNEMRCDKDLTHSKQFARSPENRLCRLSQHKIDTLALVAGRTLIIAEERERYGNGRHGGARDALMRKHGLAKQTSVLRRASSMTELVCKAFTKQSSAILAGLRNCRPRTSCRRHPQHKLLKTILPKSSNAAKSFAVSVRSSSRLGVR